MSQHATTPPETLLIYTLTSQAEAVSEAFQSMADSVPVDNGWGRSDCAAQHTTPPQQPASVVSRSDTTFLKGNK